MTKSTVIYDKSGNTSKFTEKLDKTLNIIETSTDKKLLDIKFSTCNMSGQFIMTALIIYDVQE
ncbi:MAG: hypothetical protein RSE41_01070 [Clostridia bacterium]